MREPMKLKVTSLLMTLSWCTDFFRTFYDYSDNKSDFMITVMAIIGTAVLKEIVEQYTIHTFFKYVVKQLWTCRILENGL